MSDVTIHNTFNGLTINGVIAAADINTDIKFPADTALTTDTSSTSGNQLTTKQYVDAVAEGLHVLTPAQAATTGNLDLSGTETIDGVSVVAGSRVLVKDQTDTTENGIYDCVAGGAWTRSSDFGPTGAAGSGGSAINVRLGDFIFIEGGTVNAAKGFVMTGSSEFNSLGTDGTVGTDAITFSQFSRGVTVTDSTANTHFPIVFHDESNGLLDDTGSFTYNPSSHELTTNGAVNMKDGSNTIFGFNVADTQLIIHDDQDTGDQFSITVAQHGTTTLATVDDDATAGHLILDADGEIILDSQSGLTKFQKGGDTDDLCTLTVAANGATTIATADSDGAVGHLTFNIDGDIVLKKGGAVISTTTPTASTNISGTGDVETVIVYNQSDKTIKQALFSAVCFLKGTKITLPDFSQKSIEDLTLADDVLTYNIDTISDIKNKKILKNVQMDTMNGKFSQSGIRNIWINPTDSYLLINEKLKVTKNHIVHFKRNNQYYFRYAEHLSIGDELFTDKGNYESVESIEEVRELTNVYNFELDKDNTYFAENYLVHHYCELCSGYSNIL